MKKGSRRKANKRRNLPFIAPKGVKPNKLRKNPLLSLDAKSMRAIANQAIGAALLAELNIDFIGILENMPDLPEAETETIQ